MRRVTIATVSLTVAASSVALAVPAPAATLPTITASCVGSSLAFSDNYVAAVVGDVIRVSDVDPLAVMRATAFSGTWGPGVLSPGSAANYSVSGSPGSITFTVDAGSSCGGARATLHFSPTGGGGESGDADGAL